MSIFLLTRFTLQLVLILGFTPCWPRFFRSLWCCSVIRCSWSFIAVVALSIASRTRSAESLPTSPWLPGLVVAGTEFPREVPVQNPAKDIKSKKPGKIVNYKSVKSAIIGLAISPVKNALEDIKF